VTGVKVEIEAVRPSESPPGAEVRYRVRNDSEATVWVVDDDTLAWLQDGDRITLDRSRVPMQPGV
jgi:NAD kinase